MNTTAAIAVILATLIHTTPALADAAPAPADHPVILSGAPRWIAIDTRTVSPQLLKQSFALAPLRGRFRAFRIEADEGTVEVARTVVAFSQGHRAISNKFSIIAPRGEAHVIRFGGSEHAVQSLTVITATARNKSPFGRITLYGLHVPDVLVPPAPQRQGDAPRQSAAR